MPQKQRDENVRIGPISVFTLLIVLCMAVLAVLAFSTGNASLVMSQRQADATAQLYLDERAGQEFVAQVDARLADVRAAKGDAAAGAQAVNAGLVDSVAAAEAATSRQVEGTASMDSTAVHAEFTCQNGRMLQVDLSILDNGRYRIDKWKTTAVQNEPEPEGQLLILGG